MAESIQDWDGLAIEKRGTSVLGVMLAIAAVVLLILPGKGRQPALASQMLRSAEKCCFKLQSPMNFR